MANVFSKFKGVTTTHKIKALDGEEVVLRKLTLKEDKTIANSIIKGMDKDGNPEIDYEKANESKLKKISLALVEPKMTVAALEELGTNAMDALDEIFALVDPKTAAATEAARKKIEKGND